MRTATHRTGKSLLLIKATAALCGLLFGYDTGVISGALLFLKKDFGLSPLLQGEVTSAVLAGAALGAGFSGRLADHFGRRRMVIAVAVLFFIASLMTSLAPGVLSLIAGRVLVGLAIGMCSYIGPLYISEISPAHSRGALVSLNQLLITVGILVSYLTDYLWPQENTGDGCSGWRLFRPSSSESECSCCRKARVGLCARANTNWRGRS
jgi:MFS family permease